MDPYTMVVAIVAISVTAGIINRAIKTRHDKRRSEPAPEARDHARRIERLEERVGVLEKIVTDRRHKLSDEIDNL